MNIRNCCYSTSIFLCAFLGMASSAESCRAAVMQSGDTEIIYSERNGVWNVHDSLLIGYSADGSVILTEGSKIDVWGNNSTYLGFQPGVYGELTVTDPLSSLASADKRYPSAGKLYLGYSGQGTLNVLNGGSVSHEYGYLGYQEGSSGLAVVDGVGSVLSNRIGLAVGYRGDGELRVTNGATSWSQSSVGLGSQNSNTKGIAIVSGQGSLLQASHLFVGSEGAGALTVREGGAVSTEGGRIGLHSGSSGTVLITGSGSSWRSIGSYFDVGQAGDMTVEAGGLLETDETLVYGKVTIDGADSTWTNTGGIQIRTDGLVDLLQGAPMSVDGTLKIDHTVRYTTSTGDDGLTPGALNRSVVVFPEPGEAVTVTGTLRLDNSVVNTRGLWALPQSLEGVGVVNTTTIVGDHDLAFDSIHGHTAQFIYDSEPGQHVTVNLDVSDPTNPGPLGVGLVGHAHLRIADGYQVHSSEGYLGYAAGSFGEAVVTGESSEWDAGEQLYVGRAGDASLLVAAGAGYWWLSGDSE